MVTDSIADMLIRIKNAYLAQHQSVMLPYFRIGQQIGMIMVKTGYLNKCQLKTQKSKIKQLVLVLSYKKGQPALENLKRVSKSGRRIYTSWDKIPRTLSGYGITIVSTSKGVMIGREARKKRLGGEVICQIW